MSTSSPTRELETEFPKAVQSVDRDDDSHHTVTLTDRDRLVDALTFLMERNVSHLVTISGVDTGEEIDVLYHLVRHAEDGDSDESLTVTLAMSVPRDDPEIRTITDLMPGASMYERELMDMLGIEVLDHPNPKRFLLPDDWEGGSPLRVEDGGGD